ncbi:MAG TPA: hypothetical protein PKE29_08380 [Phycisphaerales bacterium]|nr:hypothetical protein [Phycisphaerales bacterium]
MTMPLFDDAAPRPGQDNGAGVNDPNYSPDSTLARLPLTPPARHNAPAGTSGVAADRIAGHAAKQRADVLAVIVKAAACGATDADIETATGIRAQSVSPRRGELRALGLIVDSGRRRPTPRGRPAAVWVTPNHAPKSTVKSTDDARRDGGGA